MFREDQPYIPQPKAKQPENIFHRIAKADNNTLKKAQQLISEYGERKAVNGLDMYNKLRKIYNAHKDDVIPKLLEIHPDKALFENYFNEINSEKLNQTEQEHEEEIAKLKQEFEDQLKEMKMDLRFAGIKNYGDDGSVSTSKQPSTPQSHATELMIVGSIIGVVGVIGLSLVAMAHSSHSKS